MSLRAGIVVACLVLLPGTGAASCPDWLTADMAGRGVPQHEIARMCGPPATRSLAPSLAAPAPARGAPSGPSNRCVPDEGTACETRSTRMVGSPCWCFTAEGEPVAGTIR